MMIDNQRQKHNRKSSSRISLLNQWQIFAVFLYVIGVHLLQPCHSFTTPNVSRISLQQRSATLKSNDSNHFDIGTTRNKKNNNAKNHENPTNINDNRRDALSKLSKLSTSVAAASLLLSSTSTTENALAETYVAPELSTTVDPSFQPLAPITHKVQFNVRISRADGTFYIRDDPPGTIPNPDNQVFIGQLTFGLFGTISPNHVSRFLEFVNNKGSSYDPFGDEDPYPNYARSIFSSLDQTTGLVKGGVIPGLALTSKFAGSAALEYRGKILPAPLWIEKSQTSGTEKLSHVVKGAVGGGLLTHKNLDPLPSFGITTRSSAGPEELDGTYTVFGQVIPTESSKAFLNRVKDLPTYSTDRPANPASANRGVDDAASSIYSLQKEFFRGAAKSFGDTRLDNVFEGKILRRVEVTSVSVVEG